MARDQHAVLALPEIVDELEHALPPVAVEIGRRLVQQQQPRVQHLGAGQGDALLLAARKLARTHLRDVPEPRPRERLGHDPAALVWRHAACLQPEADVLGDARVKEIRMLVNVDDLAAQPSG